ncbi:MAG: hypothetical protein ACP5L5_09670, partial [Vulcanisaeta sp.]
GTGGITVSYSISMPAGVTESISTSNSPSEIVQFDGNNAEVANLTWTFNIVHTESNAAFPNAFEDDAPGLIIILNFNPSQQYAASFNVDFENYAVTSYYVCSYYTTETIWAQTEWEVIVTPQSSTTASISGQLYIYGSPYASSPPYSYVTGVVSGEYYTPCG